MKQIDEVKTSINDLFKSVNDPEVLKKLGSFNKTCDDANTEVEKKDNDYKALLNDYKDVVIHSSTPATAKSDVKASSNNAPDFNEMLNEFITKGKAN